MALDSYSGLKLEIADWLARTDLAAKVDTFIDLCESVLNRELRMRQQETSLALAVTSAATNLPADFLEFRHVALSSSPDKPLKYVAPEAFVSARYESGTPQIYTIVGEQVLIAPYQDCTLDTVYFAKITALSDASTTNFVLTTHPELYLYGSLVQAEAFMQNDARIALWKGLFEEAISRVAVKDRNSRWGSSPLSVRVA